MNLFNTIECTLTDSFLALYPLKWDYQCIQQYPHHVKFGKEDCLISSNSLIMKSCLLYMKWGIPGGEDAGSHAPIQEPWQKGRFWSYRNTGEVKVDHQPLLIIKFLTWEESLEWACRQWRRMLWTDPGDGVYFSILLMNTNMITNAHYDALLKHLNATKIEKSYCIWHRRRNLKR